MGREQPMPERFEHDRYVVRKKHFRSQNEAVSVYDPHGKLVLYADEEASETLTIPVFADESLAQKVMSIILSGTPTSLFDVFDTIRQEKIGAVERVLTRWHRERWILKDPDYEEVAVLEETGPLAPIYRLLFPHKNVPAFIIRGHRGYANGKKVCTLRQRWGYSTTIDLSGGADSSLDKRLVIATAIIIALEELHAS